MNTYILPQPMPNRCPSSDPLRIQLATPADAQPPGVRERLDCRAEEYARMDTEAEIEKLMDRHGTELVRVVAWNVSEARRLRGVR